VRVGCPLGGTRACERVGGAASVRLPADDQGLDVVPAVAVGVIGDAFLELCEEAGAARRGRLPRVPAIENHDRTDEWRDRSTAVQGPRRRADQGPQRQTARLNVASTRLRDARRAIARSEQDVEELAARQRELANEKARVEDERAALELQQEALIQQQDALVGVANEITSCRNSLAGLVNTYAQNFTPTLAEFESALSVCDAADSVIDSYVVTYGGQ
jgi:hypothetical protein